MYNQQANMSLKISVIIPVYNGAQTILHCLDAVFASKYADYEVIVVNDGSTDGSGELAARRPCQVISMACKSGQSAARNRGAVIATGDIFFFLDADITVESDTLAKIAQTFINKPEISGLFCSFQRDSGPQNFFSQYKNLVHHYTHQTSSEVASTFCGGFGAIKRSIFARMGGFNEDYLFLEDIEMGYRLNKAGYHIMLNKAIQLTHLKRYSFASLIRSDVFGRAVPWTRLMLSERTFQNDLNTKTNNMFSVPLAYLLLLSLAAALFTPFALLAFAALAVVFVGLNMNFYRYVRRYRSLGFTMQTLIMNWFTYLYSGVGLVLGVGVYLRERLTSLLLRRARQQHQVDIDL